MANIAKLPDGIAILADPTLGGQYGPPERGLKTNVLPGQVGNVAILASEQGILVAIGDSGVVNVTFPRLDALTVPYANRFLSSTGQVVIKDWRTGAYRTKVRSGGTKRPKVGPRPGVQKPQPPVAATTHTAPPKVEQPEAPKMAAGAVITVSGDTQYRSAIPGMVLLPKVTLKGAGRGNTDVGGIILPTEQFAVLEDAWHLRQDGDPAAVLITGPAGTAKTMLVEAFAAYLGVPYLKVDAGAVRTADDWAGAFRQDPNTKTWAHRWSPLAMALREGKPCILHVDELTRTETPAALNAFMGLLDETGTLLVPDANDQLRMPKGILVVATANIGPEFVGTLPLDGAVRQRFPYGIRMTNPTEAVEAKLLTKRTGISDEVAVALVRMANQQRQHRDDAQQYPSGAIISTRILLSIAKRIAKRHTAPRDAVIATLRAQFDPGDDAALSVVIDSQFPKVAVPSAPATATPAAIVAERHWFVGNVACTKVLTNGLQCGFPQVAPIHFGS